MYDQLMAALSQVKQTATKYYLAVIGVLSAAIGILLYYINLKNKQAEALQTQIKLADTQKKADVIEAQIKEKLDDNQMLQKEIDDHQKALDALAEQRLQIEKQQKNLSPDQITDYWNNQK